MCWPQGQAFATPKSGLSLIFKGHSEGHASAKGGTLGAATQSGKPRISPFAKMQPELGLSSTFCDGDLLLRHSWGAPLQTGEPKQSLLGNPGPDPMYPGNGNSQGMSDQACEALKRLAWSSSRLPD